MNLNPILQFYLVFSARVPGCLCDAAYGGNLGTDDFMTMLPNATTCLIRVQDSTENCTRKVD